MVLAAIGDVMVRHLQAEDSGMEDAGTTNPETEVPIDGIHHLVQAKVPDPVQGRSLQEVVPLGAAAEVVQQEVEEQEDHHLAAEVLLVEANLLEEAEEALLVAVVVEAAPPEAEEQEDINKRV